jgi:tRNA-modifying protein YgfZ
MQPDDLAVILGDRGVVEIEGADAAAFLDRILTVDVSDLLIGGSRYGALLSPQGKILAEAIFARRTETSFVADLALAALPGFLQRLTLMKLRAALTLRDRSDAISIGLGKGGAFDYMDPRPWPTGSPFAFRTLWNATHPRIENDAFHAARIAAGLAEIGWDFQPNERFAHDINLDQMAAIDFAKGCYVGQEIVSRMQHRGTTRTRCMIAATRHGNGDIVAGEQVIGHCGASIGGQALAFVRIDRLADSTSPLTCHGEPIALARPAYARFSLEAMASN